MDGLLPLKDISRGRNHKERYEIALSLKLYVACCFFPHCGVGPLTQGVFVLGVFLSYSSSTFHHFSTHLTKQLMVGSENVCTHADRSDYSVRGGPFGKHRVVY